MTEECIIDDLLCVIEAVCDRDPLFWLELVGFEGIAASLEFGSRDCFRRFECCDYVPNFG